MQQTGRASRFFLLRPDLPWILCFGGVAQVECSGDRSLFIPTHSRPVPREEVLHTRHVLIEYPPLDRSGRAMTGGGDKVPKDGALARCRVDGASVRCRVGQSGVGDSGSVCSTEICVRWIWQNELGYVRRRYCRPIPKGSFSEGETDDLSW